MAMPSLVPLLLSGLPQPLQSGIARSIEVAGESLGEMADRLSQQLDRLDLAPWQDRGMQEQKYIMVVVVVALVVSGVVCLAALNHWRKVQELRLRTLEALARSDKLEARHLSEYLDGGKRRLRLVLVLAWLGLIGGIIVLVASGFERGSAQEEMAAAGLGIVVGAIGVMATPIMLRELRRQGVL